MRFGISSSLAWSPNLLVCGGVLAAGGRLFSRTPHGLGSATGSCARRLHPQRLEPRLVRLRRDLVGLDEVALAPLDLDRGEILPLPVARHDPRREPALLPRRRALDERDGAEDAARLEPRATLDVVLEEGVLDLGAAHDELRPRREPEVTPGGEEDHVLLHEPPRLSRRLAGVEHVEELPGEALVGEEAAAAGRLREVRHAELPRELELPLPRAAADRLEPLAVDEPLLLRDGRREELRRQRAQEPPVEPALALHDPERVPALALRPLPEHLTREDEVGALGDHDLLRLP